MALVLANRVQETSTTTGTGTLTLAGAVLGFQTFAAGIGSGNTCYYAITSTTGAWEVGIGTVGTGTLARTTLLSSSTGSLVSFTGTLNVYVTYPSEKSVNLDASNNLTVLNTTRLGGASGNQSLQVNNVASAVNYAQIVGAVTGGAPTLSVQGTDTNIGLSLASKGTSGVTIDSTTATNFLTMNDGATTRFTFSRDAGGLGSIIKINSGVASIVTTDSSTGTISFKTNTTQEQVRILPTASAVNYLGLTGAATGAAPTISAQGSDANIGLRLTPKGSGIVTFTSDASINGLTVGLGGGSLAQNAAFGGVTLPFNTTGNFNVAVGYQSMFYNKTGTSNVGLGFATLFLNTTANQNLAMGVSALTVLTTGVATLGAITAGSGYTNGTYTAVAMTPVSGATFVTYPTVTVVVSGGAVTSVTLVTAGQGASSVAATSLTVAAALIGGTGSGFSIAVGSFATGSNNTAIGYSAGSALATGSNNTLIGYQAAASTTTVSNEVTLGNGSVTAFRIPGLSITAAASALTIGTQFAVTNTASAVNYLSSTGAVTTGAPELSAQGSDTNINLKLTPKGTGGVQFTGPLLPNNLAGTSGQVLTSAGAGAVPTWAAPVSSNITANGLFENNATISANYTIGSGNNAVSAGPITINSGVVVTVPSGSTWVVV